MDTTQWHTQSYEGQQETLPFPITPDAQVIIAHNGSVIMALSLIALIVREIRLFVLACTGK